VPGREDMQIVIKRACSKTGSKSYSESNSHLNVRSLRALLARLSAKWTISVLTALETAPNKRMRFSRLKSQLDGVSQRMLTATLKGLEADDLIIKRPLLRSPDKHEYALTTFGETILLALRYFASSTLPYWSKAQTPRRPFARPGR
jgi:DNA-binding HxlR family transcriptional regulator